MPSASDNICVLEAPGAPLYFEYQCISYWTTVLAHHPDLPKKIDLVLKEFERPISPPSARRSDEVTPKPGRGSAAEADGTKPKQRPSEGAKASRKTSKKQSTKAPVSGGGGRGRHGEEEEEEEEKKPSVVVIKTTEGETTVTANSISVLVTNLSPDSLRQIQTLLSKVPERARTLGIPVPSVEPSEPNKQVILVLGDYPSVAIKGPGGASKQSIQIYPNSDMSVGKLTVFAHGEENLPLAKSVLMSYRSIGDDYVATGQAGRGPPTYEIIVASPIRDVTIEGGSDTSQQWIEFMNSSSSVNYAESSTEESARAYAQYKKTLESQVNQTHPPHSARPGGSSRTTPSYSSRPSSGHKPSVSHTSSPRPSYRSSSRPRGGGGRR